MVRDGLPEQFTVYRKGDTKGVVAVSTKQLGTFKDAVPYTVNRADVLSYGDGLQKGQYDEGEIHVEGSKLIPASGAPIVGRRIDAAMKRMVTMQVNEEETGRRVDMQMPAHEALDHLDKSIQRAKDLLSCLSL